MSLQPAQTRPLERAASRRTVIRTAAWTAPAVSIAVAAPAFAAVSNLKPSAIATSTDIFKWSNKNVKHVTWTIKLTNNGTTQITNLSASFTYKDNSGSPATGLAVTSTSSNGGGSTTWGGAPSSFSKTYKTLMPGETLTLTGIYTSDNNAAGSVSVAFASGSPSTALVAVTASF